MVERFEHAGRPQVSQPRLGVKRKRQSAIRIGGRPAKRLHKMLGRFVEGVHAERIAKHVPPVRQPAARPQNTAHLRQRDRLIEPMERRCRHDEVERRRIQSGLLERLDAQIDRVALSPKPP